MDVNRMGSRPFLLGAVFALVVLLSASTASAEANGSDQTVVLFSTSVGGSVMNSSSYSGVAYTSLVGGSDGANSSSYSAVVGMFGVNNASAPDVEEEEEPVEEEPSSGGGGGGGSPPAGSDALARAERLWSFINAGDLQDFKINNKEIGITDIEFELKESVLNVRISAVSLADKPSTMPDPTRGSSSFGAGPKSDSSKVYKYLKIEKSGLEDDSFKGMIKIRFEVDKEWLKVEGIDDGSVVLKRYNAGQWTSLFTRKLSEESDVITYTAETPSFSYFVITGEPAGEVVVEDDGVADTSSGEVTGSAVAPVSSEAPQVESPSGVGVASDESLVSKAKALVGSYPFIPYVLAGIILVLLVSVFLVRRHSSADRDGEVLPDEPIPQPPAPVNWAADPNAPVSSAGYSDYSDEQVSIPRLGTQLQPVPAASSQAPSMSAPVEDESFTPPAAKPEIPNPRSKIAVLARDARALLSQGRVLDAEEVYMEARKIYSDLRSRHAADFSLYHELKQLYDEIQTRLSKAS